MYLILFQARYFIKAQCVTVFGNSFYDIVQYMPENGASESDGIFGVYALLGPRPCNIFSDPGSSLGVDEDRDADLQKAFAEQIFAVSIIGWSFGEHALLCVRFDRSPCIGVGRGIAVVNVFRASWQGNAYTFEALTGSGFIGALMQ